MNIAMTIDGVLRQQLGAGPIAAGIQLYHNLYANNRLMLMSLHREVDDVWLQDQDLTGYALLKQIDKRDLADGTLTYTIGQLRSAGPLQLVIAADPSQLTPLFTQGLTVVSWFSPEYARPNWRPDFEGTPRPWDTLVDEVNRQRTLKRVSPPQEER